ncbi:serine/arginine repetitive matrix protein 1-like [Eriocheir sinensis]|uniref:serine/arginine repetitive matrix protein 1-like n=1 Tax=Eriocheir sinensis TaxID=95602 RepID=UPI0021C5DBC2|nr:serine/arginine repetitive matrix protein 1-like [Eriocheir sinensis]
MSAWRVWQLVGWLVPERRGAPDQQQQQQQQRQQRSRAAPRGSRSLFTSPTHGLAPAGEDSTLLRRSVSCLEHQPGGPASPATPAASGAPTTSTTPENPADPPTPAVNGSVVPSEASTTSVVPTVPAPPTAPLVSETLPTSAASTTPSAPTTPAVPEQPSRRASRCGVVEGARKLASSATLPRAHSRRRSLPVSSEDGGCRFMPFSRRMSVQPSGRRHASSQVPGTHTWTKKTASERTLIIANGVGGHSKQEAAASPVAPITRSNLSLHLASNGSCVATVGSLTSRTDKSVPEEETEAAPCRPWEAFGCRTSTFKSTESPVSPAATPSTTAATVAAAAASLRSNLKPRSQIRRRRSDSGHSVTFDLPEDCDNLGAARGGRGDAEPLSKCMKDHQNMREQSGGREKRRRDDDPHEEVLTWLSCGESRLGLAERVPTPGISLAATPSSDGREDPARSPGPTWPPTLPEVAALAVLSPSLGESAASPGEPLTVKSPSPAATPQPPRPPTPPPAQASLEWSSTDSGGPDSGYWGAGEAPVATRRGVRVVSRGRELLLPYACLHRGRLHLRIVRGESPQPSSCRALAGLYCFMSLRPGRGCPTPPSTHSSLPSHATTPSPCPAAPLPAPPPPRLNMTAASTRPPSLRTARNGRRLGGYATASTSATPASVHTCEGGKGEGVHGRRRGQDENCQPSAPLVTPVGVEQQTHPHTPHTSFSIPIYPTLHLASPHTSPSPTLDPCLASPCSSQEVAAADESIARGPHTLHPSE